MPQPKSKPTKSWDSVLAELQNAQEVFRPTDLTREELIAVWSASAKMRIGKDTFYKLIRKAVAAKKVLRIEGYTRDGDTTVRAVRYRLC